MSFITFLLFGVVIGAFVGAVVILFLKKNTGGNIDVSQAVEAQLARTTSEALRSAQEQFFAMAKESLKQEHEVSRTDLEHKKSMIEQMVQEVRKDIASQQERLTLTDQRHVATFSAMKQELETYKRITSDLKGSTDDLRRVLSNNQLRGAFGEQVAENLLKMAGFVVGQDYVHNKEQANTETRPDFTIFLPDKTKINIDAKFPFSALVKSSATEDKQEKEQYLKQFAQDVKQKIKQVCTRDYINPEEKTVDFVILFIPNEMIFSFIYDQFNEIWEDAMVKKVILAGPFSFTAILRMIKQSYSNFRYQENLHHVIGLIQKFEVEYEKFSSSIDTLGDRISSAAKQFEAVSGTRNRALNKIVDQIKNEQVTAEVVPILEVVSKED